MPILKIEPQGCNEYFHHNDTTTRRPPLSGHLHVCLSMTVVRCGWRLATKNRRSAGLHHSPECLDIFQPLRPFLLLITHYSLLIVTVSVIINISQPTVGWATIACQFARRPDAASCLPGSDSFITSAAAGIASRSERPLPGRDLH